MDPLSALVFWLTDNVYWIIGAVLTFLAMLAFLTFLRGFLLGLNHLFYIDTNEEYLSLARQRATNGVISLLNFFVIWVIIKIAATLVGADNANIPLGFLIILGYLLLWALWWLLWQVFLNPAKKSGIK